MTRLLIVSDSHLSPRTPEADANWTVVVDHVTDVGAEFVVHAGDISLDGARTDGDLEHAKAQLDRLPTPWRAIPGNHDVGEADEGSLADVNHRRRRYETVFGDRFWATDLKRWRLVGIDSQELLGLSDEVEPAWQWLEAQLATSQPIAVIQHRPLRPLVEAEVDTPRRYIVEPVRSRLETLYRQAGVELLVTGHVHQWRSVDVDGMRHLWAPSTWATMPDDYQPVIGDKMVGLVEIDLDRPQDAALVVPSQVDQQVVGVSIPMPYDH